MSSTWWCEYTSGFILEPLNRLKQVLLLIQLALKKGIPLNDMIHPLLKVLQRHDGSPETSREDGPNKVNNTDYKLVCYSPTLSLCVCVCTKVRVSQLICLWWWSHLLRLWHDIRPLTHRPFSPLKVIIGLFQLSDVFLQVISHCSGLCQIFLQGWDVPKSIGVLNLKFLLQTPHSHQFNWHRQHQLWTVTAD